MQTIKIVALSDLHGTLPPANEFPKSDLILIGGDICKHHNILDQSVWLHKVFTPWLKSLPTDKIVGVAGNHDLIWENAPHLVPKLPWTYLQDESCEYKGWNIYGSPWQPIFFNWAFNLNEEDLKRKWQIIPENTDILLLHGPPYGYGDKAPRVNEEGFEHVGSPSLLKRIQEVKPKVACFGHIHGSYGIYPYSNIALANVSILNERYVWTNALTEIILDVEAKKTTVKNKFEEVIINWNQENA